VTACLPRILDWRRAPLLLLLAASASAQSLLPGAAPAPRTSQPSAQVAPAPPRVAPPKPPVPPVAPVAPRKLSVGDPAPPLEGLRWLKGEPVAAWQPGTTYVVEFWAPWCPWCSESLVTYANVARDYAGRKVKVVAVAVWPKKSQPEMASDFVVDQADQFPYPVAADVDDRAARAWLDAADALIPTAFVVDAQGRIAWYGDPRQGLEKAVSKLVAPAEAPVPLVEQVRSASSPDAAVAEKARKLRDWKTLSEVSRRLYDRNPWVNVRYAVDHYMALVMLGEKQAAKEWGERLLEQDFVKQPNGLNSLAWYLVAPDSAIPREQMDLDFALRAAERSDKLTQHKDPFILDTLARVKFLRGDLGEALHLQLLAVEKAAKFESKDPQDAIQLRKELAERLTEYEAAAESADESGRP
jgi:thiol-disulfide isomerase/thioredoxin